MASDVFACSFCGLAAGQVRCLISGPRVFICSDCVQLCCEILVERKESGSLEVIGDIVPTLAELGEKVHSLELENGRLRRSMEFIRDSAKQALGGGA
jgi:ATP-dependent Clp protease ATP-binding subunit ClpX